MTYKYYLDKKGFIYPLIYRYNTLDNVAEFWYTGTWNITIGGTMGKEISEKEAMKRLMILELQR